MGQEREEGKLLGLLEDGKIVMTAKELRETLAKVPDDTEVCVFDYYIGYGIESDIYSGPCPLLYRIPSEAVNKRFQSEDGGKVLDADKTVLLLVSPTAKKHFSLETGGNALTKDIED